VAGSREDLDTTLDVIRKYNLQGRVNLYISPVFGRIEPKDIVEYMLANNMNDVNLQLQLHKFIWDPEARGV
jgi:7-carboxy-7-deazaguanine synthase